MDFDLTKLSENELIELNRKIVNQLRFLREFKSQQTMLQFNRGERVMFLSQNQIPIFGIITKFNRKSISVLDGQNQLWNVSPCFLVRVKDSVETAQSEDSYNSSFYDSSVNSDERDVTSSFDNLR